MITTTLNRIREHGPCQKGWTKLLKHLDKTQADDEPLSFITILESNGVDDCLWCLRAEPQHSAICRKMAVKFARQVEHLMTDQRSKDVLDVAERYADGLASNQELVAAWVAARDFALDATRDSAWAAAWVAARAAARDALDAAWVAAWDAAEAAAWDAARKTQAQIIREFLGEGK